MASATEVTSGTIDGLSWSLWSKTGQHGADGLEDGGLVVNGTGYGLCPGYPNPAELEMLDPGNGENGIVYGLVGYPGSAKVDIYASKVGTFARTSLLISPATQVVNGVAFFIGALPGSACSYPALELNTTSAHDSAEHNLGFGSCTPGELVPISASQGVWHLAPGHFPTGIGGAGGGGRVPAGEDIYPPGADPTEAQLLANFAVLRRPQNSLDRSWRPNCDCGQAARQLTNLTRFAQSIGGYRLYFDVEQFIWPGQDNLAAGSFDLNIDAVDRAGNVSGSSFGPNTQFTVWPFSPYPNLWVSAVPDGVASVTWTFTCTRAETRARFAPCSKPGSQTVQAPVINNLAGRRVTVLGGCRRLVGPPRFRFCPGGRPAAVVWRAADGRVLATFPGFGNLPAPPFVKGGRGSRPLAALRSRSVGGARIGEAWRSAENRITRTLGRAADLDVPVPGCGIKHETVWASPAVADPLTVFERNGRLAGYTYGAPVNEIGLVRGPGAVLETIGGLTIGQTVAQASRLYGQLPTTARRGVGRWRIAGPGSQLYGQVLPTIYPLRRVTGSNPIATISAGEIGCAHGS
jgi:hypothetical protein